MSKFGKYEVLEKIGVGGFATVYKGFDPNIKRFVAIKTCSHDDEEMRTRFCQEAEIAGSLQHRNIVTVYDFGDQDGVPFLVQEYLTGEDLDRKIRRRDPLSYAERVLYLIQIARGLDYAHQKGVIHRDIKPANIRILEDGATRIMDFGIAKLAARQTGLTQTGMTLGTAAYLSPEQIRGDAADQRTDIFSFGSLAYELLTYERPFTGEVIPNVLYRILNQQPKPITAFWPQCPAPLARVVSRCMEKDPQQRYPSCAALLADLDPVLRILRAQPQVTPAAGVEQVGDAMPTASLHSGATLRQVNEPPTVVLGAAGDDPAVRHVGDMALAYRSERERRTPRSISTSAVYDGGQRRRWPLAAAAVVAVVAGAGAWVYYERLPGRTPATAAVPSATPAPPAAAEVAKTEPVPAPESTSVAPTSPAPVDPLGTTATASPPPASEQPASPSTAAAGTTAAAVQPAAPEPAAPEPAAPEPAAPAPPPPPAKTTVTIPKAWSGEMTVAVDGGGARRLDRAQTITLSPGNHVLSFSLVLPDYTETTEVDVAVKAGQNRTVTVPLRRPGRLTVQPALGSPVGMVRVDGESLGLSPVRNKTLRAGPHRVEIVPARAEDGQAIALDVGVPEDQAVVVTFNLQRPQEPPQIVARPLGSS